MPVLTDPLNKRVLFDPDGEAIDLTDSNNMQLFAAAQLLEGIMLATATNALDEPTVPNTALDLEAGDLIHDLGIDVTTDVVFAPVPSAGYVRANGVANQVVTVSGPLITVIAEPFNGDGESVAPFRLNGVQTLTTSVGHATLVRVDLVEIQITFVDSDPEARHFEDATTRAPSSQTPDKVRRTQCEIQIKEGTPGAGMPAPTVGFRALAAIVVPALHNAAHSADNVHDLRWPLGKVVAYDVPFNQMIKLGGAPWTENATNGLVAAAGGSGVGDKVYALCPIATKTARLVGVGVYGAAGTPTNTARLVRYENNTGSGAPIITQLSTLDEVIWDTIGYRTATALRIIGELVNITGGGKVAGTRIMTPLWCSTYPGGVARARTIQGDHSARFAMEFSTGGSPASVSFVRFFIAHGL